jgi:hypothetical protein
MNISFNSISEGSTQRLYELHVSLSDMNGIIKGPKGSYELKEDVISDLLNSDLIVTEIDYSTLPKVALTFNDDFYNLKANGLWNYLVYVNRFPKETISSNIQNNSIYQNGETYILPILTFNSIIPNQLIINIYKDNTNGKLVSSDTLFPTENSIELNLPKSSGSYTIEAICQWKKSPQISFGEIIYSFEANVEVLESFTLSKESYQPGDLIVIKGNYIDTDLDYTIESDLYNQGLDFQKDVHNYYIFLPIMSKTDIGTYTINITDNDHLEQKNVINIDVVYKNFDAQYLEGQQLHYKIMITMLNLMKPLQEEDLTLKMKNYGMVHSYSQLAEGFQPSMVKSGIPMEPKIVQGTQALTLLTQLALK